MNIIRITRNKIIFFGLTLLKVKIKNKFLLIYLFKIFRIHFKNKAIEIYCKFINSKTFDTKIFDKEIRKIVYTYNHAGIVHDFESNKIGVLASELYDTGGHSKCIRDLIYSLPGNYKSYLILTGLNKNTSAKLTILQNISQRACVLGGNYYNRLFTFILFKKKVLAFSQLIIKLKIKTLLVYIHPDDIFGCAVLAYLKHNTYIKILYVNHASHLPALGMSFADLIIEGTKTTAKITQEKRNFTNTIILGLQSKPKNATIYYPKNQLDKLKVNLGIKDYNYITMSGGSSNKFFLNNDSPYFRFIKTLLYKEKRLVHIVLTNLNHHQKDIVNTIINDSSLKSRLFIIPLQINYDIYFQCADVFIDSFPISSALTQIDLMRNKVASVVKINTNDPEFTFHEYQKSHYEYMFTSLDDMLTGILRLLNDPKERLRIINENYEYWLNTYESNAYLKKFLKLL